MQIAAVNKVTLLDYPKKTAAIVFTAGCNLRCSYCHNSEFVLPEQIQKLSTSLIPEEHFFRFLETRKGLLDGVVICWWEPTLQKDLVSFVQKIKEAGFLIKLDTNGTRPEVLDLLYKEKLLDYVAMDIKHTLQKMDELTGIRISKERYIQSIELILKSGMDYEFRSTIMKPIHTASDIEEISKTVAWAKRYFLQNYRSGNTLDPTFKWESFTSEELLAFKEIALQYVDTCGIRL